MNADILRDIVIPMRDGTRLRADLALPAAAPGPVPAVVMRTPYDKTGVVEGCAWLISAGYAVLVQDKRGLNASDGTYRMLGDDVEDGRDTVEWVAAQAWCSGDVAVIGMSYLGHTALSAAASAAPHLRTAVAMVGAGDQFTSQSFLGGVLSLQHAQWVRGAMAERLIERLPSEERPLALAERIEADETGMGFFAGTPLLDLPLLRRLPTVWRDVLANRENPEFFAPSRFGAAEAAAVRAPVLHVGGWFDLFAANTVRQFRLAASAAATPEARAGQRLVMGPWPHMVGTDGTAGTVFPDARMDLEAMQLAWLDDRLRASGQDGFPSPVLVYVLGANRWRHEASWPPPGARAEAFYLGAAGSLSRTPPGEDDAADGFRYDPRHPYGAESVFGLTSFDQSSHLGAGNSLVYETAPVSEETELTGEPEAVLYAASSATDTDWLVELHVVDAAGRPALLSEGILRARYRRSRTDPEPLVPGEVETYRISMGPLSVVVAPGGRIRIVVTGGKLSATGTATGYERNPNAFVRVEETAERDFLVAENAVHRSAAYPSHVVLPVIAPEARGTWTDNPWAPSSA